MTREELMQHIPCDELEGRTSAELVELAQAAIGAAMEELAGAYSVDLAETAHEPPSRAHRALIEATRCLEQVIPGELAGFPAA